jgi:hypothetical protein
MGRSLQQRETDRKLYAPLLKADGHWKIMNKVFHIHVD